MTRTGPRDFIAGLLIAAFGLAIAYYSYTHYNMGTLARMGPGMFPTVLGACLTVIGIVVAILARLGEDAPIEFQARGFFVVTVSLIAFGLVLPILGLVPALIVLVALAASGAQETNWKRIAILSVATAVGVSALFVYGLQLQVELFRWPL